jgi:hypothetical protein
LGEARTSATTLESGWNSEVSMTIGKFRRAKVGIDISRGQMRQQGVLNLNGCKP